MRALRPHGNIMENRITVETINLTTGYRGRRSDHVVTDNISAALRSGELTCLLGPNGAGKSTLLRTLSGFLAPIGGEVRVNGRPLREYSDQELAQELSVVLTDRPRLENMTVADLVALGRSPYTGFWGRGTDKDRAIVEESMALVGISHMRSRMIPTLSDGERQKTMIAKALAQTTPVIFLDEPTAFLDYPSKVEVMRLLHDLSRSQDKTIFLSTHDLDLALQLADKVWIVDKNKPISIGTPEDLALNGQIVEFFCRDGVAFNSHTGLFELDMPCDDRIALTGSQPYMDMAAKALRRYGILATSEEPHEHTVRADKEGFVIDGRREDSIEGMLETVKSLMK